ncbi:MAG: hypothetical protein IJS09_07725 [Treponema sp.]|nr:hypothetical protein [Treponema sp.]
MRKAFFTAFFFLAATLCSADLFNSNLTDIEREQLLSGQIVIRFINDAEKICANTGFSPETDAVIQSIRQTKPNYLAEVLWSIPVQEGDNLTDLAESLFCDMNTFKEIPYYSEAFNKIEPLFTIAELIDTEKSGQYTTSLAQFCMDPFEPYKATLSISKTKTSFSFLHTNNDKLKVAIVKAVEKNTLKAGIALIQHDGKWFVYGAGGVKAPKPLLFRKSLEKAFNNRIKDFASFYIKKVQDANVLPEGLHPDVPPS